MIKDRIKKPKEITDCTSIIQKQDSDLIQCPKCFQLFKEDHRCDERWRVCTICRIDLKKENKKDNWFSFKTKKHYRLINSLICYQCACKVTRMLKIDYSS